MLVVMNGRATAEQVRAVCEQVESRGYKAQPVETGQRTSIAVSSTGKRINLAGVEEMPGVQQVLFIEPAIRLTSREHQEEDTVIRFEGTDATIGGGDLAIFAGPCAVESREQAFAVAERVSRAGARFFRGGAFKPRTSPYSFQGLGREGLRILAEVRERFGLRIVTEAMDNEAVPLVEEHADIIQVGSRNMQNFSLLKRVGRSTKPVLLKRGMSATMEELLMAAEYVMSEGNRQVILCERGVRTFDDHSRNTLDLNIIPAIQRVSHLPILVDPSHGTGSREKVLPMSRAAIAAGADGLIVEVHPSPDQALSDGMQSLFPDQFDELMAEIRQIAAVVRRGVPAVAKSAQPANAR
jgi:3-deoxy-7-phosphoheptulonate synthase